MTPKAWTVTIVLFSDDETPDYDAMSQAILDGLETWNIDASIRYRDVWDTPAAETPRNWPSLLAQELSGDPAEPGL